MPAEGAFERPSIPNTSSGKQKEAFVTKQPHWAEWVGALPAPGYTNPYYLKVGVRAQQKLIALSFHLKVIISNACLRIRLRGIN